ncbi:hypothetical protein B0H19DRAFT_1270180 [Mycena capillaripes]|nr:hypothetical protein B0H19DRAFT_1270180 [Mycena capillaripes]
MPASTLEGLGQDVLLKILSLSDISTVLYVSRVNRNLRAISLVKQLWILLISDLRSRSFIETPPSDLSQHTTTQLIDQVKTLVVGPSTWRKDSDTSGEVRPQLAAEIKVPFDTVIRPDSVRLINGGRHIIVAHLADLGIWDILEKRRVWSQAGVALRFSVAQDDNTLVVAALRTKKALEIFCVDMQSWTLIDNLNVPFSQRGAFLPDKAVAGNIVVVNFTAQILLVNWRTREYVFLNELSELQPRVISLIPGYIVILHYCSSTADPDGPAPRLLVYALATLDFASHWRPLTGLNAVPYLPISLLTPLVKHKPLLDNRPIKACSFTDAIVSINESPLQRGTYQVLVCLYDPTFRPDGETGELPAVFRYKISSTPFSLTFVGAQRTSMSTGLHLSTHSGYAASFQAGVYRIWHGRDDQNEDDVNATMYGTVVLPPKGLLCCGLSTYDFQLPVDYARISRVSTSMVCVGGNSDAKPSYYLFFR